jgi:chromosome segregation ATPase
VADERAVQYVRELEGEDERLARALRELDALAAEAEALRTRATAVAELLERLPEVRGAAERAAAEADAELEALRERAERAEATLREAEARRESREVLAEARREVTRARDDRFSAEGRAERARAELERLEQEARESHDTAPTLEERARSLAARMAAFPQLSRSDLGEPSGGLQGVVAWAARARGALFVVRNALETQRERVVRQANEVLATVTGEATVAASVARARERLESLP